MHNGKGSSWAALNAYYRIRTWFHCPLTMFPLAANYTCKPMLCIFRKKMLKLILGVFLMRRHSYINIFNITLFQYIFCKTHKTWYNNITFAFGKSVPQVRWFNLLWGDGFLCLFNVLYCLYVCKPYFILFYYIIVNYFIVLPHYLIFWYIR